MIIKCMFLNRHPILVSMVSWFPLCQSEIDKNVIIPSLAFHSYHRVVMKLTKLPVIKKTVSLSGAYTHMKYLLFMSVITVACGIFAFSLSNREQEIFLSTYSTCLKSSKVDIERALQTASGIIDDEPKLKEFLFCINKQNGVQDEEGNFEKNAVRKRIEHPLLTDKIIEIIVNKCTKKQETGEETAYQFLKCSHSTIMNEKHQ
ncbi:B1 protein-like [Tribolium madens]|uniref:B1 protein-like n=1 Tax=Tribolium madens TaxID=41895 RepID=UPI001CF7412C|nr:B1 protein-like [Tribolium madens]